jgi:sugar transferase (PEP-CTERM/EpsH1 system associated)
MASRHDVLLGTFADDPRDLACETELGRWCRKWRVVPVNKVAARFRALGAVATRAPFTVAYHRDKRLHDWVRQQCESEPVEVVVVSSSGMAQYAAGLGLPWIMDFIDMDSRKWARYAERHRGPLAWLYGQEAARLLQHDLHAAQAAQCSYFVSQREVDDFLAAGPARGSPVEVLPNGVDAQHYRPDPSWPNPYPKEELALAFTGTMDYLPNVDAVTWFSYEVLPTVRRVHPNARLTVVGRRPPAVVRALQSLGVRVTGEVADVRPWLQHARIAVAPMRIAQGVQNKVLEAMAMARPVVTAPDCARAVGAQMGENLMVASTADDYIRELNLLLSRPESAQEIGLAGRDHVTAQLDWTRGLSPLLKRLENLL